MEWLGDRFTRSDRKQTKIFFPRGNSLKYLWRSVSIGPFILRFLHKILDAYSRYFREEHREKNLRLYNRMFSQLGCDLKYSAIRREKQGNGDFDSSWLSGLQWSRAFFKDSYIYFICTVINFVNVHVAKIAQRQLWQNIIVGCCASRLLWRGKDRCRYVVVKYRRLKFSHYFEFNYRFVFAWS